MSGNRKVGAYADSARSCSAGRLVDILIELQTCGAVNRYQLMRKFNITERTVYRDLNMLSSFIEGVVVESID
jgi:predicted DNA-binding transcriptional regulator YafY